MTPDKQHHTIPPIVLIATRALAHIAKRARITNVLETAEAIGCSVSYLEQICARLKAAGLIHAQRGPGGGYELARLPTQISVADIYRALVAWDERKLPACLEAVRNAMADGLHNARLEAVMLESSR